MATITFLSGDTFSKHGKFHGYKTHTSMKRVIDYITREDKTREELIKGLNCSPQNAYEEFLTNKMIWNKTEDGERRMLIHFTQSFPPEEGITPETASEMAEKLMQHDMFKGFQVICATHIDTKHIHTHFVIDACNKESGHQWQMGKADLQRLKDYSDDLCREYQLSVCEKQEQKCFYQKRSEQEAVKRGVSYKEEMRIAAEICSKEACSKTEYVHLMKELGISVIWKEEHKYIVYRDAQGHKVRDFRLAPDGVFTKQALMKQFALNKQYQELVKGQIEKEQIKTTDAYYGIRNALYIAKEIIKKAEQPYPLQHHDAFRRMSGKAGIEEMMAEEQKGKGYER